jgi:CMP-2-keto-3-deoxyoctulosonic acid synthetase
MMRLLENNIKVKMVPTLIETHSVDVPSDIKIVERMMKK